MKNLYLLYSKDEIITAVLSSELRDYSFKVVQPYTTRPKKYKLENGYIFTNDEIFDKQDLFVSENKNGYWYGISLELINGSEIFPVYTESMKKCIENSSYKNPVKVIYVCSLGNELDDIDDYFIGLDGIADLTIVHTNVKSSCDRIHSFICDEERIEDGR